MSKTTITVRDVDEDVFRKFRALSIEEKAKLGDALSRAMKRWIEAETTSALDPKDILKIRPVTVGTRRVTWSEDVDEIVYG